MTHDGTHDPADERIDGELDGLLADLRRSYNAPPAAPPFEEMWGRIERQRFGARWTGAARSAVRRTNAAWWLSVAAALLLGVGIGRLTRPSPTVVAETDARAATAGSAGHSTAADTAALYDRTTARYLGQTAALLVALPAEARAGRTDQRFVARAAELLTTTRLLLDSPAAADPNVRALLEDVELVLAQVAHLEVDRGRVELELIAQALEQRDLLPRLTSAAAGSAEGDN